MKTDAGRHTFVCYQNKIPNMGEKSDTLVFLDN